jgi:hypothetical protein
MGTSSEFAVVCLPLGSESATAKQAVGVGRLAETRLIVVIPDTLPTPVPTRK